MSTGGPELERLIRDALRGEQIAETDLIHPTLRSAAPRTHRRVAAALAAAVVIVVAAVVGVLVAGDVGGHRPAGGDPLSGVVGYRWRVTHVVDAAGGLTVPASIRAEIGFTRDGYVLGDDTVNAMQASYTPTADGYTAHNGGGTLVGSVGLDPARERTVQAVDAFFVAIVNRPDETPPPLIVKVAVDANGLLMLEHDGIQLTLTRFGQQPDFFAQSPSPTSTSAASQSATAPPNSVLRVLAGRARSTATANKDPNATGEAVRSTYRDAERVVLDGATSSTPPGDTQVWVIQLHGSFTCDSCSRPAGAPAPHGTALALIVNAQTFEGYDFTVSPEPHDLAELGAVFRLPM